MMVSQRVQHERKIILMLIVCSVVVFGLYFGLKFLLLEDQDSAEKYSDQIRLEINPLAIQVSDEEETYTLIKETDEWVCDLDPDLKISRIAVTFMKTAFMEMETQRVITDGANYYEAFGLSSPNAVITVSGAEGEKKYKIGDYNAALDEYYVSVDGSNCVFLIGSDDIRLIYRNLLSMVADPEITNFVTDAVKAIRIVGKEFNYDIRKSGGQFTVNTGEKEFSCSEYKVTNLCSALSSASYQCRYRDASEADKRYCGLDHPEYQFLFETAEGNEHNLVIGRGKDECYYLNENNSKVIYQIKTSNVEKLAERLLLENLQ